MKLQTLLLFCFFLFTACSVNQKAQLKDFSNNANVKTNAAEIPIEAKQAEKTQSKKADDSRFSSVKIKRTDNAKKFFLRIDVDYPQIKKAKISQEIKFNEYVKKQVDEQLADFTKFLKEKETNVKTKVKREYEINLTYTIDYFSGNFTSVVMNWNGYSGYLNMDYFPSTINFDLKTGKIVEQKDFFEPNTKYLDELSKLSRQILKKTCLSCGCGNGINAGDPLPEKLIEEAERKNQNSNTNANSKITYQDSLFFEEGTEAKEENFDNWSVTAEGLKITFGEYQVGPGCIGIIDIVIPFEDLQTILRKDLEFK